MKLNWHFQTLTPWSTELVNSEYVKVLDPAEENLFSNSKVIGRWSMAEDVEKGYWGRGAAGAEDYFELWREKYEKRPWVYAWESVNEPNPPAQQDIQHLVQFTKRWGELMQARGYKTVGLCLAEGWPEPEDAKHYVDCFTSLDYIGLHEYGAPTMQSGVTWHCLRYRRTYAEWKKETDAVPPFLITECGIDGGAADPPQPRKGWKTFANQDQYWQQLQWYDGELEKDDYVIAAFIFTSGPFSQWLDFDFDRSLSERLHDAIGAVPPPVPGYESHFVLMAQNVPHSWRRALENYFDRYKVTNGQSHDDAMVVHGTRHHITLVGSPESQYGVPQGVEDHIRTHAPDIQLDRMPATNAEQLKQVADERVANDRRYG